MDQSFEEQARKRKELAEKRVRERHHQLYKAESERTRKVREEWKKLESERKEKEAQQMKREKELLDQRMAQLKRDTDREKEILARNHQTASRMENKKCAFGSSTPRELSYLNNLRKDQKIYDHPLSPEGSVSTEVSRRSGPPSRAAMSSIMSSSVYITPIRSAPKPKTANTENTLKARPQVTNSARSAPKTPNLMTQSLHMGRKSLNEVPQRPKLALNSTPKRDIKSSKPPRASPAPTDKAAPKKPSRASLPPVPKPRVEKAAVAKKSEKKEDVKRANVQDEEKPVETVIAAPAPVQEEAVAVNEDVVETEQTVPEVLVTEENDPEPVEEHAKFTIDSRSESANSLNQEVEAASEGLPASTEAHLEDEAIKLIEEAIDTAVSISDGESHHEEPMQQEPIYETAEVNAEEVEIVIPPASPEPEKEAQQQEELISLASPIAPNHEEEESELETEFQPIQDLSQEPADQESELEELLAPVAPLITVDEPKPVSLAEELSAVFGEEQPLLNGSHHDSFDLKEEEVKNATNSQHEEKTSDNEVSEPIKETEEARAARLKILEAEEKEKAARKARLAEIMTNVRAGGRVSPPSEDGKTVPRALSANTLAILQRIKKEPDNGSVQVSAEPTATAANM